MRPRLVFIIGIVLAWSVGTGEAGEPEGFAEFVWGTPRATILAPCQAPPLSQPTYILCPTKAIKLSTGAGSPLIPALLFLHDRLAGYMFLTNGSLYPELRDVAAMKFGQPSERLLIPYRNGLGHRVEAEHLLWRWPSGVVAEVQQVCEDIGHACLTVQTKVLQNQNEVDRQDRLNRAKGRF